jgi:dihydropteroate synthase
MNINCGGKLIDLTKPKIMGILNVTPDSFYDGGKFLNSDKYLMQVEKMLNEGATFIDIGGMTSKPGSKEIPVSEELSRVIKAVENVSNKFPKAIISVDTYRSEVAEESVNSGAQIINDISGGSFDNKMFKTIAKLNGPYIIMHINERPETMQQHPEYEDILFEIGYYFSKKVFKARAAGINDIIIDPGFGFGKELDDNYKILKNLNALMVENIPMMIGVSRKSMIYKKLKITSEQSLNGTTCVNTVGLIQGVNILRVHDVKEAKQCIDIVNSLNN